MPLQQYKIQTFDFEVFKDWWCCSFYNPNGTHCTFETGQELEIIDYIIKNNFDTIFVGYNNVHFDNYCMKCLFNGVNPWVVVQKVIIDEGWPEGIKELKYKKRVPFYTFDLMQILGKSAPSLKAIEACLGLGIVFSETIISGKTEGLTEEEKKIVKQYNVYDCYATMVLYEHLKGELEAYLALIEKFNLPMTTLEKRKAQIFEVIGGNNFKTQLSPYQYRYKRPSFVNLNDKDILDKVETFDFTIDNDFEIIKQIDGVELKIGRGGLHGARKNYTQDFGKGIVLGINDFTSFYPGMMANEKNPELRYIDTIIDWKIFKKLVDERIAAKKSGNKVLANGIKIPINAAFGKLIDKYFKYYYWPAGLSICLTGELIAYMICERLEEEHIGKLVQVNTDGMYYALKESEVERYKEIMKEYQDLIGIDFETEIVTNGKIVQKDVNNYIIYDADKNKSKCKGVLLNKFQTERVYAFYSNAIVSEAIAKNLLFDTPINKTIMDAFTNNEAVKFQLIFDMKGKNYTQCYYGDKKVNKINRGFASCNVSLPDIRKEKLGTKCKFPDAPEHILLYNESLNDFDIRKNMLDIQWYIDLANDGVQMFKKGK